MVEKLAGDFYMTEAKLEHFTRLLHKDNPTSVSSDTLVATTTSEKYIISYPNAERFFIKRIPDYAANPNEIETRYKVQKHLHDSNFPACLPICFNNLPYTIYEDKIWQAFPFYEGGSFKRSANSLKKTTAFLASFHRASTSYEEQKGIPTHSAMLAELFLKLSTQEMPVDIAKLFKRAEPCLEHARAALSEQETQLIWCHGDFSQNNILYEEDMPVCLLDFDNMHLNNKLHDLAEMSLTLSAFEYDGNKTNFSSNLPDQKKIQLTGNIIDDYFSTTPRTREDDRSLPYYLALVYMELSFLGLLRKDFAPSTENADKIIDTCKFILSDKFRMETFQ